MKAMLIRRTKTLQYASRLELVGSSDDGFWDWYIEFQPKDIIHDFALRRVGTVLIFCLCEKIKVVTSERYCYK